jgi:hypothetical protein
MIANLFSNWHAMRWVRLLFAIIIGVQAYMAADKMMGLLSGFFFFQALTNTGCCGVNACNTNTSSKKQSNDIEDVQYEEIK